MQISDHELQVNLCKKADLVLAKGSQIEDYKDKLRLGNDIEQDKVFTLMPSIPDEFSRVQRRDRNSPFQVLLSASVKYFEVKGCCRSLQGIKRSPNSPRTCGE